MCGRYTPIDLAKFTNIFPWLKVPDDANARPRYNIAPTQQIAVVANHAGEPKLEFFMWGLVPMWADDPKIGNRMINARSETLASKPAFRDAYNKRRCLILADGFYEWQDPSGGGAGTSTGKSKKVKKIPYWFRLKGGKPFAIAGLWERWRPKGSKTDDPLLSCVILTGQPNEIVRPVHDRMPVILLPEKFAQWLDPNPKKPEELDALLKPYPAEEMESSVVTRSLNTSTASQTEETGTQAGLFGE